RADADDIVDDRADGVDADVGEAILARRLEPVPRDDRFRSEPLDDERELLAAELENERRRSPGRLDDAAAVPLQQVRCRLREADRRTLGLVQNVVVDAQLAVLAHAF